MDKFNDQPIESRLAGDSFYIPLIASFVNDLSEVQGTLAKHISSGDFLEGSEFCHQLGGTAATYGYPELGTLFEQLEKILQQDSPDLKVVHEQAQLIYSTFSRIEKALPQEGGE